MNTALLLVSAALLTAPAERWIETFVMELIVVDGQRVETATVQAVGSPTTLCIPKADADDVARWLRKRDSRRCRITSDTVSKDRLILNAQCVSETATVSWKVIDLQIARHSYAGTYVETGTDSDGRAYRMQGRITAQRVGVCRG